MNNYLCIEHRTMTSNTYRTFVYYENEKAHQYTMIDIDNGEISHDKALLFKSHRFEMTKGYQATEDGLRQYAEDFKRWNEELKQHKIDYTKYYSHMTAVVTTFMRYGKKQYKEHTPIGQSEAQWMDKCNNGGLSYYDENGEFDCYAYDFKAFYPWLLNGTTKIPTRAGTEHRLTSLPDKITQAGYYRVRIECNDPEIKKLFSFSKHHTYTHQSLTHAKFLQRTYTTMTIDLIIDDEPNAYLYDGDCMVKCSSIFQKWFDKLYDIKTEYPDNKLVKRLLSTLWGTLSSRNARWLTMDEIKKKRLSLDDNEVMDWKDVNGERLFHIRPKGKPFKYNIRLKPFITARGRVKMANKIDKIGLDNIQSIMTDGVVYKHTDPVRPKFDKIMTTTFITDDKYTGRYRWTSRNRCSLIRPFYPIKRNGKVIK